MADNDSNNIGWFLAGLGLGALVGVLYAPKSGKETRDTIVQGAMEGRDYVVNRGRQAGEQVGQWVDKGREVYSRQKEQFSSAVEAGKQAYREAVSEPGSKGKG
jgi:gas vesicle protein